MRGLRKLAPRPLPLLSSSSYSTFSGGASGRGRGRGSGAPPPPQSPPPLRSPVDDDAFVPAGRGHGQPLPSWISTHPTPSAAAGRGRGLPPPPPPQDPVDPKKPIFFSRDASTPPLDPNSSSTPPLPSRFAPILPGAGRGKPTKPADPAAKPSYENRHIRPHSPPAEQRPRLSAEEAKEATKKAIERLSRDGGRRGRGGRGMRGGRGGRGRGGRFGDRRTDDDAESGLFLGDNADGERLEKRLGEETMKKLNEEFEEMSYRVLPSPSEDAYLDALHTNNMIEYEPEYLVEFDRNPDIDEKPPMSLEDALEKVKPFLMAYEGIKSQEEWEEAIKETMEKVPHMKELIDMYCGPDRVTAKQQQHELERVAQTLPENIPSSVRRFSDRALLSLQSNPGWGWDKKCQFMDKLAWEVTQHYK